MTAPSCEYAVVNPPGIVGDGCGRDRTWPVCSKPRGKTPEGLCDMAGNVGEWVEDCYESSYDKAPNDGSAQTKCGGSARVDRGGGWDWVADRLRGSNRSWDDAGFRGDNLGFRLASSP